MHYKDKIIRIMDVEMERYNCLELFRDARAKANEEGIEFPKYAGFRYHPPHRENQRWHLNVDDDWVRLMNFWEDERSKCVPIYMYDLKKPSENQKHVESLDKISTSVAQPLPPKEVVESKGNVKKLTTVEDLTNSEAKVWADSMIVSPTPLAKLVPHRPVTRSISHSPAKATPSSQPSLEESPSQPISTSLPKVSPNSLQKQNVKASPQLPLSPSMSAQTKFVTKPSDLPTQESPYPLKPQTRSSLKISECSPSQSTLEPPKSSKKPKSNPQTNPGTQKSLKAAALGQASSSKQPRNTNISKCASPLKPLSVAALGISELKDFDIESLCKEPQWEVDDNEWVDVGENEISIVGVHIEGDRAVLTSVWDNEDDQDSEDVSLDEELGDSASGEDADLEAEVEQRTDLGAEIIDTAADQDLVANKMARTLRQGKLWSRNRDGKVSLVPGHMFTSKEELLAVMREYCIQEGFTMQKVKNEKTRYTQKCANPQCTWRIHCSVLVDRVTWMVKTHTGFHCCGRPDQNRMATAPWVSQFLLPYFMAAPKMEVKAMQEIVMRKYGVQIPNHTCWRARRLMKDIVHGKHEEGYKYLTHYTEEFKAKNPGYVTFISWTDQGPAKNPIFKHMLICVGPSIAAFKQFCRLCLLYTSDAADE